MTYTCLAIRLVAAEGETPSPIPTYTENMTYHDKRMDKLKSTEIISPQIATPVCSLSKMNLSGITEKFLLFMDKKVKI